ncbi:sugar ABC transporter permease [Streptomyces sp. NBC_01214]|uniref:sugar ABC transporter permease n=1 Tax=Streptomyces sp. NBC_01214 TaxID=2903777 RepID=UPI002258A7CE|nr:sugar ABC transporter permease [Streptomyces sp. NBC_01214]MCX4807241.1 sugar ABC transporter permease [Streptomyces sp. NBC_01214]
MSAGGAGPVPALAAVMERVAVTAEAVGPRFPLYADPADGRWTTTGRGSWTGGFWAGLLWLRARYTGAAADRRAAAACTARLEPWVGADTATRGLILWYGTAPAGDDAAAAELRDRAARAVLAAHDRELGLVPWGDALGGPRLLARVDGVPGTVPLLAGAGPEGAAAAAAHLHRHLDLCLGAGRGRDLSLRPALHYDAVAGWQPCADPPPGWSRGRAWLLLAVADALLRPDPATPGPAARLAGAAELLAAEGGSPTTWGSPRTESGGSGAVPGVAGPARSERDGPVPAADAARPDGPLDTSAAAITAVALLKLARVPGPRAAAYAHRAEAILHHLAEHHLTGPNSGRPPGMLLDGCYDAGKDLAVRHELIWGDFFLALGLAALDGVIDITRI